MESNLSVENNVVTAGHHDHGQEHLESDGKPDESDDDSDIEDDLFKSIDTLKEIEIINNMISVTGDEKQYRPYLLQNYFINYMKHNTLKNYPLWYSDRRRLSECREEDEDEDKKDVSPKPSEKNPLLRPTANTEPILDKKNCNTTSDTASTASTASDNQSVKQASNEQIFDEEDKVAPECDIDDIAIDDNINDNDNDNKQDSLPTKRKFIVVKTPIAQALDFNKNYKMFNTIQIPATETYNRPTARALFNRLSPMPSPHLDRRFFDSSLVEMRSLASSTSTLTDSLEDIWIRRHDFSDWKDSRGGFSSGEFDTKSLNSQTTTPGKSTKSSYKGSYGSRSASNSRSSSVERRKSGDEQQFSPKKATFESLSRPRSKSDVTKKKGNSFMSQMRHAMQSTGLMSMRMFKDGSAHPVKDCNTSDTQYYHTVTAAVSTNQSRSAMTKVMDIFRNRSHTSTSPDDRKKSKNLNHQYSLQGAHLRKSNFDLEKRRQSLGSVHHRSSDLFVDPQHAAILFRDARGLPVVDPFLEKVNKSELQNEYQIFVKFFKFHTCYDLIPNSAKLVVFDTQLSVKKAFYALVYNGVRAAPLWDCDLQEFVGMLTITDFIRILQMHYASNLKMDELENHKLDTWKKQLHLNQPLISINPENSLFDAIKILIDNKIHRLPIIDPKTGDVLHILTHKRILKFLYLYINELPKPSYVSKTLKNCQVGTYKNIEVAYENTTIIAALDKFVERRISALPIVDKEGKLIDIYAKFDVINLAADKTYNDLDVTLRKANEHRNEWFEGVYRCKLNETLFTVIEKFVKFQVHRLVVVDDEEKVIGIISLSDLFQYLILNPVANELESKTSSLPKIQDIFFVEKVLSTNEEPLKITDATTDTDQSDNSDEINDEFSDNSANSNSNSNSNANANANANTCLTEVVVSSDQ